MRTTARIAGFSIRNTGPVNVMGELEVIVGSDVTVRNDPEATAEIVASSITISVGGLLEVEDGVILQSSTGRVAHIPSELVARLADSEQVTPRISGPVNVG